MLSWLNLPVLKSNNTQLYVVKFLRAMWLSGRFARLLYFKSMKEKLIDEIKDIFAQSTNWIKLEVEYAKFTVAEKFTMLMATLIIGAVCMLLGFAVLLMLAFAGAELFKLFMAPALAYCAMAGVVCVLLLILFLMRRPLLLNPIAKFITRLFFNPKD